MKTEEREKPQEIEMEGATIKGDARQFFNHTVPEKEGDQGSPKGISGKTVTAESLIVNGQPIAIAKASDLGAFLASPTVGGLRRGGVESDGRYFGPDIGNFYVHGSGVNPSELVKGGVNPDDVNRSDGTGNLVVVSPLGNGWYAVPSVDVGGGRPFVVFDDTGDLGKRHSIDDYVEGKSNKYGDNNVMHSWDDHSGFTTHVKVDQSRLTDSIDFTGSDISEAWKQGGTPAPTEPAPPPEPTPEPPSSFQGFEVPVVDTLKGRRRQAKRRFAERQELTDE